MAVSQAELEAMYRNNPAQARRDLQTTVASVLAKPVFLTGIIQAKPNKYRNEKQVYDGMKFDSKHELECWRNLKLREKAGEIEKLERQVRFPMVVNGKKVGRFTADFVWRENHQTVVADAKSPPTRSGEAYRLRKKLWEAIYSPLVIREL